MNSLIEYIGSRVSCPKLVEPAPGPDVINELFEACLRVPDHLQLRPWRFLLIEGEKRKQLGLLFAEAERLKKPDCTEEELVSVSAKALRAPMIIVGICNYQSNPKVPELEQQISTACVLHNLGLALRSLGFASIWRTGSYAFDTHIKKGLGLKNQESIIGYLYIGTPEGKEKTQKTIELEKFLQQWP